MSKTNAAGRLRSFRKRNSISLRGGAKAVGVSHVTLKAWEEGRLTPSPPFRAAIETWTSGDVPANSWPIPSHEARALEASEAVEPFRPSGT
jgi:transcriptional regulator with XRE-family HTH domain